MTLAAPAPTFVDLGVIHERGASKLPYIDLRSVHINLRTSIFVADFSWYLVVCEGERLVDLSLRVWDHKHNLLEPGKDDTTRIVVLPWRKWHFDERGRFVST